MVDGEKQIKSDQHQLYVVTDGFGLLIVGENKSENESLQLKFDCSKSSNLVSSREVMKTADSLQPGERQVILLLSPTGGGYSMSYRSTIAQRRAGTSLGAEFSPQNPEAFHVPELTSTLENLH